PLGRRALALQIGLELFARVALLRGDSLELQTRRAQLFDEQLVARERDLGPQGPPGFRDRLLFRRRLLLRSGRFLFGSHLGKRAYYERRTYSNSNGWPLMPFVDGALAVLDVVVAQHLVHRRAQRDVPFDDRAVLQHLHVVVPVERLVLVVLRLLVAALQPRREEVGRVRRNLAAEQILRQAEPQ